MESLENKNTKEKTRCEIGGKVFEKQKERQARSATHRARRIKQAPCRLYSFCKTSLKLLKKGGVESELRSLTQTKVKK